VSSFHVACPVEDCGIIAYVELDRFKRHLAVDHDRADLVQVAFQKGIVQDRLNIIIIVT